MSAIELLAQSAQNKRGRTLEPEQVLEVVEMLQALQYYYTEELAKNEALTRVASITIQDLGGSIEITPDDYDAAKHRGVELTWEENSEVIHAKVYQVDMSEVQLQEDTDERPVNGGVAPVPGEGPAQLELALEEVEEDRRLR